MTQAHLGGSRPTSASTRAPGRELSQGELLENRLRVGRVIGRGSASIVHMATNLTTDKRLAIKWPTRDSSLSSILTQAKLAGRVRHPAVLEVYDVGQHEGTFFLIMEYVPGAALDRCVTQRLLSTEDLIQGFDTLLGGVQAVHERGLVHRDVKPSNIVVERDDFGRPRLFKLVDFGSAIVRGDSKSCIAAQAGSEAYMAPEQRTARGAVDARSDVFALGVSFTRCALRLHASGSGDARIVEALRVAAKARAQCPDDRFQSALEFRLALRGLEGS